MKQMSNPFSNENALSKEQQFREAIEQFQKPIYYFIRRMLNNHEDAHDVSQNTFVIAWEKWDQFRGQSKRSTWLHTIAYREALKCIERKSKNVSSNSLPEMASEDFPFDGDEILIALEAAMQSLPEKQKAVFILRYFEEKTYEEIAAITDTSVGALKANYHHAAEKIKTIFKKRNT
jgi:RNA polymerase sigma-70 factor (ECF subfamily)